MIATLPMSCQRTDGTHSLRPHLPETNHAIDGTWTIKTAELGGKPYAAPLPKCLKNRSSA